ncbi:hypothetical protein P9314_10120 [Paenibacillus validus]|uniref:hypothetical protein n=1 Tax=Paenibacillus validus TaxID=44253 RepID=UPI000FD8C9CA|nr:hypothetical protein [Paenibacillus validus]MED4601057.1 hypothetical protein [Paenibacillus validus]MED4607472.1 hypothetical protein [Paenibacillus validus]
MRHLIEIHGETKPQCIWTQTCNRFHFDRLDWPNIGLVLERNGNVTGTAAGAAVLGHPARADAWLANKWSEYLIIEDQFAKIIIAHVA